MKARRLGPNRHVCKRCWNARRAPIIRSRIRELFIKHYRVLYEIEDRAVYVLGLIHGAREFNPDETN